VQVQKTSKVLRQRLLSKSEDVDFVNKFNIVFTMTKERISQAFFHNMFSAAAFW
jgi:hypothetical protein